MKPLHDEKHHLKKKVKRQKTNRIKGSGVLEMACTGSQELIIKF